MNIPYRILVVDDDEHALDGLVELLRGAGYDVTGAATYDAAGRLLVERSFDVFVVDVRLRGFNGLHLVKRARAEHPDIAIIIISGYETPLMELEAGRYQAVFVPKPVRPSLLLETVARCAAAVRRHRRWPRKRITGGFRVTAAGHPAAVLEVGYGGLRLEVLAETPLPPAFEIEVSGIGLQLPVQPVWTAPSANSQYVQYGAALMDEQSAASRTWRVIVDRLTA